jgi:hypothetical protein
MCELSEVLGMFWSYRGPAFVHGGPNVLNITICQSIKNSISSSSNEVFRVNCNGLFGVGLNRFDPNDIKTAK